MVIDEKQLAEKPKQIGLLKNRKVMLLSTKGGFHLIMGSKDGQWEPLGSGSHPAIARHLAERNAPDIQWTGLAKSDHVPLDVYEDLLPDFERITNALRQVYAERQKK